LSDYKPKDDDLRGILDHAMEECGEFIADYGKMCRHGAFSYDPTVPESERENNIDAVLRELDDVVRTASRARNSIRMASLTQLSEGW
jgi:hypothetical protein